MKLLRVGRLCVVGVQFELTDAQVEALEKWLSVVDQDEDKERFGVPYRLALHAAMDPDECDDPFSPEDLAKKLDHARDGLIAATECVQDALAKYGWDFDGNDDVFSAETTAARERAFRKACAPWLKDDQFSDAVRLALSEGFEAARAGHYLNAICAVEKAADLAQWKTATEATKAFDKKLAALSEAELELGRAVLRLSEQNADSIKALSGDSPKVAMLLQRITDITSKEWL